MGRNPFLKRNKVEGYKLSSGSPQPLKNEHLEYPFDTFSPYQMVEFLEMVHQQKGFSLSLPKKAYLREAKKILSEFGGPVVTALILKAGDVAEHPFSFKFVRRMNDNNS